jgi:hypothetical protein
MIIAGIEIPGYISGHNSETKFSLTVLTTNELIMGVLEPFYTEGKVPIDCDVIITNGLLNSPSLP